MTTAAQTEQHRPGPDRRPSLAESVEGVDKQALIAFIDRHEGVLSDMVEDQEGLQALGLVTEGRLERGPLGSRLAIITDITQAHRIADRMTARGYADSVRVRSGRLGPRKSAEASRSAAETRKERQRILDAIAIYGKPAKHGRDVDWEGAAGTAAKYLKIGINELRRRELALGISDAEIKSRRAELLQCVACKLVSAGEKAGRHAHITGCSRADG